MRLPRPLSIRLRIVILVLVCEAALLSAGGSVIFYHQRRSLTSSFDSALRSNAEALATLLEYDTASEGVVLDFSDEVMKRFSRNRRPEAFAVLGPDGALIESSRSMKKVPSWVRPTDDAFVRDLRFDGRTHRGIVLPTVADSEDGSRSVPVVVFFAMNRGPLDSRLGDSTEYALLFAAGFLLASAGAVWWATGRGLAPIARLAEKTRSIDERNLGVRFVPDRFSRELRSLAGDFNALLERLDSAFERERRFSSDAAHELRTPVASLKAGIQSAQLRGGLAASDGDMELVSDLLAETERLEALCESLLDLARGETGTANREISSSVLETECRDAVAELSTAFGQQVPVEVAASDADAVLGSSATSVRRIVSNLVGNALTYAGSGARVRVVLSATGAGASIAVEDDGPGIPEEMASRVFERFFRADAHRARTQGGAGLGLSICRALAESEGGEMIYEPVVPHGCRFVWRIALATVRKRNTE